MYRDIRFRAYSFELRVWNPKGFVGLRVMSYVGLRLLGSADVRYGFGDRPRGSGFWKQGFGR